VLLVAVRPWFHGDASGPMSLYLVVAAAVAVLGGVWTAAAGLSGAFLLDYFFIEPIHSLAISSAAGVVTVLAFLVVTPPGALPHPAGHGLPIRALTGPNGAATVRLFVYALFMLVVGR
jgi:Domain of unknown function (DUF4118)